MRRLYGRQRARLRHSGLFRSRGADVDLPRQRGRQRPHGSAAHRHQSSDTHASQKATHARSPFILVSGLAIRTSGAAPCRHCPAEPSKTRRALDAALQA
ncbi:hypothetical protein JL2886_00029 [Phaeobacter gallaeciensis]|uniref:Uncharacterized protein n=1 Tax=Phaeobacter gallaeciensis TaxID=60890 RepID=A0A1B0ZLE2_9RHOB|nr:hypothetical protein JL2886_00029 [Phaeobacter gallaeciensis]